MATGHFLVDLYQNTLPPLMPLIGERLGLSLTAAGLIVAVASFTSSLLQPLFGYLSDRGMSNATLVPGVLWIILVMSGLYWAPGFWALLLIAALGGLGGAMYHPQGSVATAASSGPHRGLGIAVYSTAGNLGYTLSPLFIISVVSFLSGTAAYATILVPGLVGAGLMLAAGVHRIAPVKVDRDEAPGDVWRFLRTSAGRRLLSLSLVVCARAWTLSSLVVFIPHFLARQGHSTMIVGTLLTAFLMAGTVMGMFGGALSDRFGRIRTIAASTAAGAGLLLGGLLVPGAPGLALLIAGGGVFQASFPATIAFAQETSGRHAAMASGMMMGFGWGVGGILVALTGVLADAAGLVPALTIAVMVQVPVCLWLIRWRLETDREVEAG